MKVTVSPNKVRSHDGRFLLPNGATTKWELMRTTQQRFRDEDAKAKTTTTTMTTTRILQHPNHVPERKTRFRDEDAKPKTTTTTKTTTSILQHPNGATKKLNLISDVFAKGMTQQRFREEVAKAKTTTTRILQHPNHVPERKTLPMIRDSGRGLAKAITTKAKQPRSGKSKIAKKKNSKVRAHGGKSLLPNGATKKLKLISDVFAKGMTQQRFREEVAKAEAKTTTTTRILQHPNHVPERKTLPMIRDSGRGAPESLPTLYRDNHTPEEDTTVARGDPTGCGLLLNKRKIVPIASEHDGEKRELERETRGLEKSLTTNEDATNNKFRENGASTTTTTTTTTTAKLPHPQPKTKAIGVVNTQANDVLMGRGAATNFHPGNIFLQDKVMAGVDQYRSSRRLAKALMAKEIVWMVHERTPPGRFLRYNETTTKWDEVDDTIAETKTKRMFRENGASTITTATLLLLQNEHPQHTTKAIGVVDYQANDVLIGRGAKNNFHPGNKFWRDGVMAFTDQYRSSGRVGKAWMAKEIVRMVHERTPPGRFLKHNETTTKWDEVDQPIAESKTKQRFREKFRDTETMRAFFSKKKNRSCG